MRVLILGIDGYIGWSLALHLKKKGHEIFGIDDFSRRKRIGGYGLNSVTPIAEFYIREEMLGFSIPKFSLGIDESSYIKRVLKEFKPEAIVHLAEQPSAPWSMKSLEKAMQTQEGNVLGTLQLLWTIHQVCPQAHLIKLGTMGEYGTPNCDIPEGRIPEGCLGGRWQDEDFKEFCPMSGLLFPRTAGSFYHLSKVMDSLNIEFCCRNWGLRSTDIMQGVVFGLNETDKDEELTRFDYDECFGTVLNRFCAQTIAGFPLTIYGSGTQTRGFLPLKDSLQCITLALEQPAVEGEYRTLNQFESTYSINQLAQLVLEEGIKLGIVGEAQDIPNPRNEAEHHYYNPAHQTLFSMGYIPTTDIRGEIKTLLTKLLPYKDRINKDLILPKIQWR